jgi:hypothetical protein
LSIHKWSFCPIPALAPWNAKPIPLGSGSNFNPRNTQCIPACPACPVALENGTGVGPSDRNGVVNIIAFLELKQKLIFFKGLKDFKMYNPLPVF